MDISPERRAYLRRVRIRKNTVAALRIGIMVLLMVLWEVFAYFGIIDDFVMSSPSRMIKTVINVGESNLFYHIGITCLETFTGFISGSVIGIIVAVLLWWNETVYLVSEPYLVVLNSLPKIALGPVIIIWVGAGQQAIIVMALAISLVVTVLEVLNGFASSDVKKIRMAQSFGADKKTVFIKIVFPSNLPTVFNSLKVGIGLSLVGVIAGEFLVSKGGLGYLIVYGGQVFKMDLVMASVFILSVMAFLMYKCVILAEKLVMKTRGPKK